MSPTCERVVNIHRYHCGRPAVALVTPPPGVLDRAPLPVCTGHRDEHERWGHTIHPIGAHDA